MSGHWADRYVGRPAEGARPCWLLVRQVWADQLGFEMPRFDEVDDPMAAIDIGARAFTEVAPAEAREFDAVLTRVPGQRVAPGLGIAPHIGVIASKKLMLHVELAGVAVVEPLRSFKVMRILRGPWAGVAA